MLVQSCFRLAGQTAMKNIMSRACSVALLQPSTLEGGGAVTDGPSEAPALAPSDDGFEHSNRYIHELQYMETLLLLKKYMMVKQGNRACSRGCKQQSEECIAHALAPRTQSLQPINDKHSNLLLRLLMMHTLAHMRIAGFFLAPLQQLRKQVREQKQVMQLQQSGAFHTLHTLRTGLRRLLAPVPRFTAPTPV